MRNLGRQEFDQWVIAVDRDDMPSQTVRGRPAWRAVLHYGPSPDQHVIGVSIEGPLVAIGAAITARSGERARKGFDEATS